jgi:chemotaxis protein CheY-P-specific phosphatase CheC
MNQERSDLLREVAGQTLEQLAFIFSFPDDMDPDAIWEEAATGCHVTFNGPSQGELLLIISNAAMPELASNMLGMDEEEAPPEDQQKDALQEALNVICGNLLPKIGGTEAVFDIQAPKIIETGSVKTLLDDFKADPQGCASAFLSLDDGGCQLYMRVKSDA